MYTFRKSSKNKDIYSNDLFNIMVVFQHEITLGIPILFILRCGREFSYVN